MTIPTLRTFTGDTYLSGTDMQWNFNTIKTAINGGVTSADIANGAGFTLEQVAQNGATNFVSFPSGLHTYVPCVNCELYDMSVVAKKTDTADTAVIGWILDENANEIARVERNETSGATGYKMLTPTVTLKAGVSYPVRVTPDANIKLAVLRLGLIIKHTKR